MQQTRSSEASAFSNLLFFVSEEGVVALPGYTSPVEQVRRIDDDGTLLAQLEPSSAVRLRKAAACNKNTNIL